MIISNSIFYFAGIYPSGTGLDWFDIHANGLEEDTDIIVFSFKVPGEDAYRNLRDFIKYLDKVSGSISYQDLLTSFELLNKVWKLDWRQNKQLKLE